MLPAVALALLALAGCTFVGPVELKPESEPYTIKDGAVLAALGEVPEGEPMTPEREADFIARFQNYRWSIVTQSYPDAVRPTVTVADTTGAGVSACVSDGLQSSEQVALADYVCFAQNPPVPTSMLSSAQAGYLYDYWTGFVVPCYAEHGFEISADPPVRERFVAEWPFQNWAPTLANRGGEDAVAALAELEQFCPGVPDELS
ncbi:hypothetical protein GCM10027413_11900 [Conyzicola nivalis]|uniref:Lipoprotein n=2 Tax=Conyzicola nivalis TaxID=1477021 RepID=A0A916SJV6_9MICO|nr:hypothetical protein GCM10010979_14730 [Conyzicola nivalis]